MKWVIVISFALIAGCDNGALETGYRPHKLTDTSADRQAYYASPFSPEASQASNKNNGPDSTMSQPGRY